MGKDFNGLHLHRVNRIERCHFLISHPDQVWNLHIVLDVQLVYQQVQFACFRFGPCNTSTAGARKCTAASRFHDSWVLSERETEACANGLAGSSWHRWLHSSWVVFESSRYSWKVIRSCAWKITCRSTGHAKRAYGKSLEGRVEWEQQTVRVWRGCGVLCWCIHNGQSKVDLCPEFGLTWTMQVL